MRLLLDTHAFLWFIGNDAQLSEQALNFIADKTNEVFVSVVSFWEIAIKISIGKLTLTQPFETFIPQQLLINDFRVLEIDFSHTVTVTRLPFHHRDPFDRLLISQALTEHLSIVSTDAIFDNYPVTRLW